MLYNILQTRDFLKFGCRIKGSGKGKIPALGDNAVFSPDDKDKMSHYSLTLEP